MALNLKPAFDRILSLLSACGEFDKVNDHEPTGTPGKGSRGVTAGLWEDWIGPAVGQSGQNQTTGRVALQLRIFVPATGTPGVAERKAGKAAAKAIEVLSGDFELGGSVRCVDLLGMTGTPLSAQGGWLMVGSTQHRIMDVVIPLIINDIWAQEG